MGACSAKIKLRKSLKRDSSVVLSSRKIDIKKANFRINYKIEEKLSDEFDEAFFLVTDKTTAAKRMLRSIPIDEKNLDGKTSKFKELHGLDHPNIVNIVDIFLEAHFLNVITEYCSGGKLLDKIEMRNNLTEKVIIDWLKQISSALIYLHSLEIIHKHLTPAEILFVDSSDDSSIKITGIGKTGHEQYINLYRAPETFRGNYYKASDIWSLGIILYILASGNPPYQDNQNEDEYLIQITTNPPPFKERVWDRISPGTKSLIQSMLTKDHTQRPTARQIFDSQLNISNETDDKTRMSNRTMVRLCKFSKQSKFKKALLSFIMHKTSVGNRIIHFVKVFQSMDVNGDGMLSTEEILEGLEKTGIPIQDPIEIIKSMDSDKSGSISYSEFLAALVDWERELSIEKLTKAFNELDINGDGFISADELGEMIGSDVKEFELKKFMKEADSNGDGFIDFKEFCDYLTKIQV